MLYRMIYAIMHCIDRAVKVGFSQEKVIRHFRNFSV